MRLSLTVVQRVSLMAMIRRQRNGSTDEFFTLVDLFEKIKVPDDEVKDLMLPACSHCGTQTRWSPAKMITAQAVNVDLEKAEARRLVALIDGWREFSVDDAGWLSPLRKQLKDVETSSPAPAAADAPARGPRRSQS